MNWSRENSRVAVEEASAGRQRRVIAAGGRPGEKVGKEARHEQSHHRVCSEDHLLPTDVWFLLNVLSCFPSSAKAVQCGCMSKSSSPQDSNRTNNRWA